MKKSAKALIAILALAMLIVSVACSDGGSGDGDTLDAVLLGTWEADSGSGVSYTFNEDGTGAHDQPGLTLTFKYTTKDGIVTLNYDEVSMPNELKYSVKENQLTLEDTEINVPTTYTKK